MASPAAAASTTATATSTTEAVAASLATEPTAQLDAPPPYKPKLHGRAFYESIGSPKYIIAPMVDQSEFAWRMLSRSFLPPSERGRILAYTPMLHARLFVESQRYRDTHFQPVRAPPRSTNTSATPSETTPATTTTTPPIPWLDGNPAFDRPLIVQFCANDPAHLLAAAQLVAPYCDAVDLNLGCPQGIARKGRYGAFLQEDVPLIQRLVRTLHERLPVPVTAKIRVLDTPDATLAYARAVLAAGASVLTVHGRRREQKGHLTGLADWGVIRYLREELPEGTVLFANGNVLRPRDVQRCLEVTGADGVMSAEGNLSDPGIFGSVPDPGQEGREYWRGRDGRGGWRVDAVVRRYLDVLHRYVYEREPPARRELFVPGDDAAWLAERPDPEEEEGQPKRKKRKQEGGGGGAGGTSSERKKKEEMTAGSPNLVSVQGHLFHLLRHFVARHHDVRDALARARAGDMDVLEKILDMVERKVAEGLLEYERTGDAGVEQAAPADDEDEDYYDPDSSEKAVRVCRRPWWVVQPIIRPVPKEAMAKGAIQPKREKGTPRNKQRKEAGASAAAAAAATAQLTENGDGKGDVARVAENGETPGEGQVENTESLERKTSFPESELVSG